jgi:uncharacterized protein YggE
VHPHAVPPQAAPRRPAPTTIAVTGIGRAQRTPELMRVVLSVEAVREHAAEAMAAAGVCADRVVAAARSAGVAAEDIRTVRVSLLPGHGAIGHVGRITGYRAGESFQLTVRHLGYAGPTLELLAAACGGQARIESVDFGVADPAALRASAREQAFAEAEARARHYARLAGHELGPLLSIEEEDTPAASALFAAASAAQVLLAADRVDSITTVEEQVGVRAVFAVG